LPIAAVAVISLILFVNAFMTSVILPFIAFMVSDFGVAENPDEVSRWSGWLMSSYMFGQMLASYFWGSLSDRIGRRPVILFGLSACSITCLLFGFSTSFWMAIGLRFLNGAVNGIVSVTKTYLSEITDDTNVGQGFSLLGLNRALGMIVGPAVGGLLCLPAEKYPAFFPKGSFFDRWPYALPTTICFFISVAGTVAAYYVLEETHSVGPLSRTSTQNTDGQANLNIHDDDDDDATALPAPSTPQRLEAGLAAPPTGLMALLSDSSVLLTIACYALVGMNYVQYDELIALWSRLQPDEGGPGFTTSEIGMLYSVGGIGLFLYQIFCFAPVERRLGVLTAFRMGVAATIPALLLLPYCGLLRPTGGVLQWTAISLCILLRMVMGLQAMTCTFIMLANATTPATRGAANGLGQMTAAMGRMIGPIVVGSQLSWGLE
ncbi:hypothetical protein CXG81DRAFT_4176, partial [Caulochytrium protostelioides]